MSEDENIDVGLATKSTPKTKKPKMYKVLLLNDDYTPMEFVVHVLERYFGTSGSQAYELMMVVHQKGLAVVGIFSHDIAETKVMQVTELARKLRRTISWQIQMLDYPLLWMHAHR